MSANLATRLDTTARALALLLARGDITLDQLAAQMRVEIARAHAEVWAQVTQGQATPDSDAALREIIQDELTELDRLMTLLRGQAIIEQSDVERRLSVFGDALEDTADEGERMTQGDVSPLALAAIGGAVGALLNRARQQQRVRLPRIDSRQFGALRDLLGERLDTLADDLATGRMTPDQWYESMQQELRLIHDTYARLGQGTLSQTRLDGQLTFLEGFRGDVEGMDAEAIKRRARMYLDSGQASFHEALTTALGMPLLPAYPKDGSTQCRTNDLCFWRIEALPGNGNWNAYWTLRPAENCPTCLARSMAWNPIEIRNGILGDYSRIGTFT
jgi:hypothetical protein